jgi:anti-anti-sigma regulatory factor
MSLQLLSPAWEITNSDTEGVTVALEPEELDSKTVWVLFDELFELAMESLQSTLYVDCDNVRRVARIVFGKLITLDKKLRKSECRLVLCNVEPGLYRAFQAARLTENLEIREKA